MIWSLEATAENISVSARLGLIDGDTIAERFFGALQFHVHRLCQWIIALSVGVVTVGIVSPLMMSIPNLFLDLSVSYDSVFRWLPPALTYLSIAVLLLSGLVLAIGIIRAGIALSCAPAMTSIMGPATTPKTVSTPDALSCRATSCPPLISAIVASVDQVQNDIMPEPAEMREG